MSQHRINIREYVGTLTPLTPQEAPTIQESAKGSGELPDKIITVVEAIHSGLTRNYTFYPAQNLEKSVESWTAPYGKPVIKNHDTWEEPTGRVLSAAFKQSNVAPDKQTIELKLEITDPDTIRKVLDGRYHTLSIGGSTNSAVCSVCGKDLVKEGYCGHMKGRQYEGKQAYWIIGEMDFDEISWVNVPADRHAQVVQKNVTQQKESVAEGGAEMTKENVDQHTLDLLEQIDKLRAEESTEPPADPEKPAENAETPEVPETPAAQAEGSETPEPEQPETTVEEQLKAELQTLKDQLSAKDTEIEGLKESNAQLDVQIAALTDQVSGLQSDLSVADEENKGLVKQNVSLASYTHKVLAESVANLKIVLGKTEEGSTKETLVTELMKEPARILKDQITSLAQEKPATRQVLHVDNPTLALNDENQTGLEATKAAEKKEVTIEDLAERMAKAFNRKHNN